MPYALLFVGILFLVVGFRGTQEEFLNLLKGDFTGEGNFLYWIVSLMVVGAIGFIPKLKPISDGFLVLILVVLFLKRGPGFFSQFQSQVFNRATPAAAP